MFKKKNKKIYIWIMWSVLFGIFIKIEKIVENYLDYNFVIIRVNYIECFLRD